MLLFCIIVGIQATRSYDLAVEDGKHNADRLTRILADHTELIYLTADLTLRRAVERQYFNLLFGGNLPEYMEHNFRMWVDETPPIVAMMMVNEKGVVEVAAHKKGYERWVDYGRNFNGAVLFDRMKEADDDAVYIGPQPMQSNPKKNLVVLSRKLSKLDGSFGGVVTAAIDPAYFIEFFNSVEVGTKRNMALSLMDRTLLVSGPGAANLPAKLQDEIFTSLAREPHDSDVHSGTRSFDESIKGGFLQKIENASHRDYGDD